MTTQVNFAPHLRRFIELPETIDVEGATVRELVDELEKLFPGVAGYLVHENGRLRQHVNLFLDQQIIEDRVGLTDSLDQVDVLFIMQALSGG